VADEPEDKRLYRRVDVVVPFGFRPADRTAVVPIDPELPRRAVVPPDDPVMAALERIERQLAWVINRLEWEERSPPVQPTPINLSGAGVRFAGRQALAPGAVLELALVLPSDPPIRIRTFGEVVRHKRIGRAPNGSHEIAVKFVNVSERDRESIIRYTFRVTGR
jgi:hypothetical protein